MSAGRDLQLLPNLGAEEGPDWRRFADLPAVARASALWASLFGASARISGPLGDRAASPHPGAAFDWLPTAGAIAWWGDAGAAADPALAGRAWCGPPPEITTRVHDKAFALRHGPSAPPLAGLPRVLEPEQLRDPDAALATIRAALEDWPPALRARFCLKPRLGSSGRGRALGRANELDSAALRGALARLAERGGAILEPWLERTRDLSVSFHLGTDDTSGPPIALLGTLASMTSAAGVPLGHLGQIDHRGRLYSGAPEDDAVRAAGVDMALAAFEQGYRGPCGVDAFVWRDDEDREWLRPVAELNARFTLGIVALGCLRRARRALRDALGLEPGVRAGVLVAYSEPAQPWQALGADLVLPIEVVPACDPERGPAILGVRDPAALEPLKAAVLASTAPAVGSEGRDSL